MAIFLMFIKANLVNMYITSHTSRVFQHIKSCILKNWKYLPSKLEPPPAAAQTAALGWGPGLWSISSRKPWLNTGPTTPPGEPSPEPALLLPEISIWLWKMLQGQLQSPSSTCSFTGICFTPLFNLFSSFQFFYVSLLYFLWHYFFKLLFIF